MKLRSCTILDLSHGPLPIGANIEKMFPFDWTGTGIGKMERDRSRIDINISVLAGLDVLSPDEREGVLKAIASLESLSPDRPLDKNIQKIRPEQPFYLLHIDPSLRVIFEVNRENQIEIKDLFRKEMLEWFAKASRCTPQSLDGPKQLDADRATGKNRYNGNDNW